jgi:hypothetical protein
MLNKNFINKKKTGKKTKLTVYKTTYLPTLTTKHISQIQCVEMRYLRRIEGKTRRDKVKIKLLDGAWGLYCCMQQ